MDNIREEFEVWFNEIGSASVLADTMKDDAGNYYFQETRLLWVCWQASRQALVVQLPKVFDAAKEDASYYEYAYLQPEVEKALDAAGVSYK